MGGVGRGDILTTYKIIFITTLIGHWSSVLRNLSRFEKKINFDAQYKIYMHDFHFSSSSFGKVIRHLDTFYKVTRPAQPFHLT